MLQSFHEVDLKIHSFFSGFDIQFSVNAAHMRFYRTQAYAIFFRDLFIGPPQFDKVKDFSFLNA